MNRDGGPAFPFYFEGVLTERQWEGMSLRDYFAGQVVSAMVERWSTFQELKADLVAIKAYQMADAMIKAREAK